MKIRKAVITAAGRSQRAMPLQTIVAQDGTPKSVLAILADEIAKAGIEDICVVTSPGDEARMRNLSVLIRADSTSFLNPSCLTSEPWAHAALPARPEFTASKP